MAKRKPPKASKTAPEKEREPNPGYETDNGTTDAPSSNTPLKNLTDAEIEAYLDKRILQKMNVPAIAAHSTADTYEEDLVESSDMPSLPKIKKRLPDLGKTRRQLTDETLVRLGDNAVKADIGPKQVALAIDRAVRRYRQRSSNAMQESHLFLTLERGASSYSLPADVQEVTKIYRRGIGSHSGTGVDLDPFELSYTYMYVLQAGRFGGLTSYELFRQFQETAGRLFGSDINYVFDRATGELNIYRRIKHEETVIVRAHMAKPEEILLTDTYSRPWLEDWAFADCKQMIAEIRGKYSNLPGPGGGVALNAPQLAAEAQQEKERLEQEIKDFKDGGSPPQIFMA